MCVWSAKAGLKSSNRPSCLALTQTGQIELEVWMWDLVDAAKQRVLWLRVKIFNERWVRPDDLLSAEAAIFKKWL